MEARLQSFIRDAEERFILPDGVSNIEFKLKNREVKIKKINGVKIAKPIKPLPRAPDDTPPDTSDSVIPLPITIPVMSPRAPLTSQFSMLRMINSPRYTVEPLGSPTRDLSDSDVKDIERKLSVSIEDLDSDSDSTEEEVQLKNIVQRYPPGKEPNVPKLSNMIVLSKNITTDKKVGSGNVIVKATKRLPKYLREKFRLPLHKLRNTQPGPTSPTSPRSPRDEITLNAKDIQKLNEASLYNLRRLNRAGPLPQIISVAITALDDKGRQVPLPDDLAKKIPSAINGVLPRDIPLAIRQGGQGGPVSEVSLDMTDNEGKKEKFRIKQCAIM